jgi:hypothetical protein
MIRKWTEVLRRRMMWRGCINKTMRWWCVRSWDEIWMVHRSMGNGSRVADGLYIKRVLLALEDFLFFSLYTFSCIAKQVTTLKQLRLLSCLDFLETNLELLALLFRYCIIVINITHAIPRPLHSTSTDEGGSTCCPTIGSAITISKSDTGCTR